MVVGIWGSGGGFPVPGLLRARQSGNEASAIGSVRAINSAEATYAASCGGGGYAQTLTVLGLAPAGGVPFLSPDPSGVGRAACRGRGEIPGGGGALKKK